MFIFIVRWCGNVNSLDSEDRVFYRDFVVVFGISGVKKFLIWVYFFELSCLINRVDFLYNV